MAQIIDEDANIKSGLEEYLSSIGITNSGTDYHIISIIGAQSSGKSTLLNHMFGTEFQTMNEITGRQQTTKGIHCAYDISKSLIFDIEGSDSRERGDSDALFERKAALFALALSEVVMVNMWQNDIGRYQASSIPLLRTVFEVNMQLFATSAETKCHLLFVIRDATLNQDVLEKQVRRDLDMIWAGLTLPANFAGRPFEDFFIFHFEALPHLRLKPDDFKVAVANLARSFNDPNYEKYLFSQQSAKIIPGDGLAEYIRNIWDAITDNKELNLPSQRRQLSNFKCDTFANQALEQFMNEVTKKIAEPLSKATPLPDFKGVAEPLIQYTLSQFDINSAKYVKEIVDEKRSDLVTKINYNLFTYYEQQCRYTMAIAEKDFKSFIDTQLPSNLVDSTEWEQKAREKLDRCKKNIGEVIKNSVVLDFKWDYDPSTMESNLDSYLNIKLADLVAQLEDSIFQSKISKYKPDISVIIEQAPPDMWAIIRKKMRETIKETHIEIDSVLAQNTINRKSSTKLDERFYKSTVSMVLSASRFTSNKMINRFEEKFNRDENGKTRTWKPDGPDINLIFEEARDAGLHVLKMFTSCQLREENELIPPHDILTQTLIGPMIVQKYEDKYTDITNKEYTQAVRIRESMRIKFNIPWWMIGLMIFFGYDKIVKAIHHPIAACLIIGLIVGLYALYMRGYLDIPIYHVKSFIGKCISFIFSKLRGKLPAPPPKKGRKRSTTHSSKNKQVQPNEYNNDIGGSSVIENEEINQDLFMSVPAPSTAPKKKRLKKKISKPAMGMSLRPGQLNDLQSQLSASVDPKSGITKRKKKIPHAQEFNG